jgi:hypothetical protein
MMMVAMVVMELMMVVMELMMVMMEVMMVVMLVGMVGKMVMVFLVRFIITVTKILDRNNSRRERFILVHGFKGVSPSWQEECGEQSNSHPGSQEAEEEGL